MSKKTAFALFFLSLVCNWSCKNHKKITGPVTLKFNLEKGSRFGYNALMKMRLTENISGQQIDVANQMGFGYEFEVRDDSAGWKILSSTFRRIYLNLNAGGQSIHIDTDSTQSDTTTPSGMMTRIYSSLMGGQFSFTMDGQGNVGRVFGMQEMIRKMAQSINPGNPEPLMLNISKSIDENNFRQNIEQSFKIYPDHPVKEGEQWTGSLVTVSNGLTIQFRNIYTLQSIKDDIAHIKVDARLSSRADTSYSGASQVVGEMHGETDCDIETGIPLKSRMDMQINMVVGVKGQQIPVKMHISMETTGKKE
jgi:hypothetical protein